MSLTTPGRLDRERGRSPLALSYDYELLLAACSGTTSVNPFVDSAILPAFNRIFPLNGKPP